MKRRWIAVIFLFVFVLCISLSGCKEDFPPYEEEKSEIMPPQTFTVYVCGAVENEGYVTVEAGETYLTVLELAGILPQSVVPQLHTYPVDGSVTELIVNYSDGEQIYDCINADNLLIAERLGVEGLPTEIVELLADYIAEFGAFHNKQQLKTALGEYAEEYHYRFFISEENYEKAD